MCLLLALLCCNDLCFEDFQFPLLPESMVGLRYHNVAFFIAYQQLFNAYCFPNKTEGREEK
jgi:hypothetical protein